MGKPLGLLAQPEPGVTWVSPGCHRVGSAAPRRMPRTHGHPRALPVSFSSFKPRAPLPKPLSLLEQHLGFQQCPSLTLEELLPLAQPWALPGGSVGRGCRVGPQNTARAWGHLCPVPSWGMRESLNQRARVYIPSCTLTSSYIFIWLCST